MRRHPRARVFGLGRLTGADPVAGAGAVVPDAGCALVLTGSVTAEVRADPAVPVLGHDLVGAVGTGGVAGAVVAAGLAHHDRLGDRPVADPVRDLLLRLGGGDLLRLLDLLGP